MLIASKSIAMADKMSNRHKHEKIYYVKLFKNTEKIIRERFSPWWTPTLL